ncbi:MAG: FtsQ-type POTRA domain-containing protein [bacterium]
MYLLKGIGFALITAVLSFGGTKLYNFVFYSEHFKIKSVTVMGNHSLEESNVLKLSGLSGGENIFGVNNSAIESLMELHPSIKKVDVKRKFPDRLLVSIKERMPLAVLKKNDIWYGMDEDAVIFKFPVGYKTLRLPVIKGFEEIGESEPVKRNSRKRIVIKLINEFLSAGLPIADEIMNIDVSDTEDVTIDTKYYGRIRFGDISTGMIRGKLTQMASIFEDIKRRKTKVEYVDMRFSNAVIKPAY